MLTRRMKLPNLVVIVLLVLLYACQSGPGTPAVAVQPSPISPTIVTATPNSPVIHLPSAQPSPTVLPWIEAPVVWHVRGSSPDALGRINQRLNALLSEVGLNMRVEIHPVRNVSAVDSASFDIAALDAESYQQAALPDSLLALSAYANPATGQVDNLLEMYAPLLWAGLPDAAWQAVQIDNAIYAVPNQSAWVQPRGVSVRADVVQALSLEADLEAARSFPDLTPILQRIQNAIHEGNLADTGVADDHNAENAVGFVDLLSPQNAGYEPVAMPFVVHLDDDSLQLVNWYATAEFAELAQLRRSWHESGFTPSESRSPERMVSDCREGRTLSEVGIAVWAGSAAARTARCGYEWVDYPLAPAFLPAIAPLASLTVVSARSAGDPERVKRIMMFLELLHNDPRIYNLLAHGMQDVHWRWVDSEAQVITQTDDTSYRPDWLDQIGDRTLSYAVFPLPVDAWQQARAQNALARPSPLLGFTFDSQPVAAEAAAVRGLTLELLYPLANGQARSVEREILQVLAALDAAGAGALEAELNEQLAAWK